MDTDKFETFIIIVAIPIIIGYRSLCSERLDHAVDAVHVTQRTLREGILFVILFT